VSPPTVSGMGPSYFVFVVQRGRDGGADERVHPGHAAPLGARKRYPARLTVLFAPRVAAQSPHSLLSNTR
jgi:hypothetical protein